MNHENWTPMFFQWTELRLLNPVYILSHFALRCFYILWLNLPLVPLLTHHETRDECKGVLIFILLRIIFIFSAIFSVGATLPFSSLTHFSSLGFSTAPTTMSLTPIRPGNSSPACTAGAASHMQGTSLCQTSFPMCGTP